MQNKIKNIYITTPLYFVNDRPHLGHLYSTLYGDFLKRYFILKGYQTFLLVGCDQNGEKVYQSALNLKENYQEFITQKTQKFKDLWKIMKIDYQYFVETKSKVHINCVQDVFEKLWLQKDVILSDYKGFYCLSCENWISLKKLSQKEKKCLTCEKKVVLKSEKNYFLKISKNEKQQLLFLLKKWDQNNLGFKWFQQIKNFLNDDKLNFSISRFNLPCGIPIGEKLLKQKAYVWFDALLGYFSHLSKQQQIFFTNQKNNDTKIIQILGKEITKFHLLFWPFILQKLSYKIPDIFLVHGWILQKGKKMSKSLGNVVDPFFLITKFKEINPDLDEKFSIDLLRLFIGSLIKSDRDIQFEMKMINVFYEKIFLNNIWNFCYRLQALISQILKTKFEDLNMGWLYFYKKQTEFQTNKSFEDIQEIKEILKQDIKEYQDHWEKYQVSEAFLKIQQLFVRANMLFDNKKMWVSKDESFETRIKHFFPFLLIIKTGILFLKPFAPFLTQEMLQYFGIKDEINSDWLKLTFIDQNFKNNSYKNLKNSHFSKFYKKMIKLRKIKGG